MTEAAVTSVNITVKKLELEILPQKTESMWFYDLLKSRRPPLTLLSMGSGHVLVEDNMWYLVVTIEFRLSFDKHFSSSLAPRVERVAAYLGRLLLNVSDRHKNKLFLR